MMRLTARFAAAITASAFLSATMCVYSQTPASASESSTRAENAKPSKAERKAARKEAREKKNQELKKLEDAGYNPAAYDNNYPESLQKAENKTVVSHAASQ